KQKTKIIVSVPFALYSLLIIAANVWLELLFLSSIFVFLIGIVMLIYSLFRKRSKKSSLFILGLATVILVLVAPTADARLEESTASRKEEERQEELAQKEKEEQEKQKE